MGGGGGEREDKANFIVTQPKVSGLLSRNR